MTEDDDQWKTECIFEVDLFFPRSLRVHSIMKQSGDIIRRLKPKSVCPPNATGNGRQRVHLGINFEHRITCISFIFLSDKYSAGKENVRMWRRELHQWEVQTLEFTRTQDRQNEWRHMLGRQPVLLNFSVLKWPSTTVRNQLLYSV